MTELLSPAFQSLFEAMTDLYEQGAISKAELDECLVDAIALEAKAMSIPITEAEESGFASDWSKTDHETINPAFKCRRCGSYNLSFREWTSPDEAHEDIKYRCDDCGRIWWVEGVDA